MMIFLLNAPFAFEVLPKTKDAFEIDADELKAQVQPRKTLLLYVISTIAAVSGCKRNNITVRYYTEINQRTGGACLRCEMNIDHKPQLDGFEQGWEAQLNQTIFSIFSDVVAAIEKCNKLILDGRQNIRFSLANPKKDHSVITLKDQHALDFIELLIRKPIHSKLDTSIEFHINDAVFDLS